MKRIGNLYNAICSRENLRLAYWKARRGKAARPDVIRFGANLDAELELLEAELRDCRWDIGHYSQFRIFDPKERVITAAPFRERVLHHAVMNVCEPFFEKWQLDSSHACRKGRGLDSALDAARRNARAFPWHLKLDVRKYFDSIPHDILLARLGRRFKDGRLLALFAAILDTYGADSARFECSPHLSRGLPIGNLTSQFFANFYLEPLDRFVKETFRAPGYVRYMDDFVIWGRNRETLKVWAGEVSAFCRDNLALELKPPVLNRSGAGLPFLGYVVRPISLKLGLRAKKRFVQKIREAGKTENHVRAQSLLSFAMRADSLVWRRKILFGASDEGLSRVNRGGSWNRDARYCRSARRVRNYPGRRDFNLGLRVVLARSQEKVDAIH